MLSVPLITAHRFQNSPQRISVVPVKCSIKQLRQILIKRPKQIPQFVMKIMFEVMASGSSFSTAHATHSGRFEAEKLSLTVVDERILIYRC